MRASGSWPSGLACRWGSVRGCRSAPKRPVAHRRCANDDDAITLGRERSRRMHDVVRQQHHLLMDFMPGLPALGRAGRSTAKKTLDTVAVRLAAAVVLALVSVAPAWAAADSVSGLTMPRLYP